MIQFDGKGTFLVIDHVIFYFFFLPTTFETSIHFSGTPKLPSSSSTAGVCLP